MEWRLCWDLKNENAFSTEIFYYPEAKLKSAYGHLKLGVFFLNGALFGRESIPYGIGVRGCSEVFTAKVNTARIVKPT